MEWHGKINFHKPITLEGKHHGVEPVATLPVWQSSDAGRVVYAEDTGKLWVGNSTEWVELTPGGVGDHDHDDRYYTEVETDLFFEGYDSGKAQISWARIIDKPTNFTPEAHGNEAHSTTYISESDVTFETLDSNGDVGVGTNQLAIGSHNHDTQYEMITPLTTVLYVDGSRGDTYAENGSMARPYKTINGALSSASAGMTIVVSSGAYVEDIIVPAGVSLVSHSQVKVSIEGDATFEGPGTPITIHGMIFTGTDKTLTVNCTAHIFESYSYSRVIFGSNAHISANVFNINVNQLDVDAVTFNGSGDLNIIAGAIHAHGDSHGLVVNSGRVAIFNSEIDSENASKATVQANGGTVVLTSSQIVNSTGGASIDLTTSDATSTNPNALSGVISVGNIVCGSTPTILDGIDFITTGSLSGTDLRFRPSTQIGYDNSTSGLTSATVQDAIDELENNKLNITGGNVSGTILPDTTTVNLGSATNKFGAVYAQDGYFDNSSIYLGDAGHAIKVEGGKITLTNDGVTSYDILSTSDFNTNDYYTKVEADTNFITASQLSDETTSTATAGYQEIELTGQSVGDESGLNGGSQYFFTISVDGNPEVEYSITPNAETQGYQELGLTGVTTGSETGLSGGSQYYFTLNSTEYDITTQADDPATQGYQELGLTEVTTGSETGLSGGSQYYFILNGTEYDITTQSDDPATQGYQELGLTGVTTGSETGLAGSSQYFYTVNGTEYDITTDADTPAVNEETVMSFTDDTTNANSNYDGAYFDIYDLTNLFRIWYNLTDGTSTAPADGGGTLVQVDITTTSTADDIAAATASAVDALTEFSSSSTTSPITIDHNNAGDTIDADASSIVVVAIDSISQGVNSIPADTTWGNILPQLNTSTTGFTWSIEGDDVRVTNDTTGSSSTVSLSTGSSGTDFFVTVGATFDTSVDGTDAVTYTTWSDVIPQLNAVTTGFAWSIESDDIRVTNDTTGSSSTVDITAGSSGTDLLTTIGAVVETAIDGTDLTTYTTWSDVLPRLNTATTGFTWSIESDDVRVTNDTTGSSSTVDLQSGLGIDLFSNITGFTAFETAVDGTDTVTYTTWSDVLPQLNTATTGFTWSIEGDDVRVTDDTTGSSSTVSLSAGSSGTDLLTTIGAVVETAIDGTDSQTTFNDILSLMNSETLLAATWTWEDGNLRLTSNSNSESSAVIIGSASSGTDLITSLNGYVEISPAIAGTGSDTSVGASLIGVAGITGLTPAGGSDGDAATLQEMLEAIVARLP